MIEIYQEENTPVKAFLVGFENLSGLKGLVKTLGMEVCGEILISKVKPNPQYYLGTGKTEEIIHKVEVLDCECIIFDKVASNQD